MKGFVKVRGSQLNLCYICNRSFTTNSSLKRHKKIHESEFYCFICFHRALNPEKLEHHMNLHLKVATLITQHSNPNTHQITKQEIH